MIAKPIRLEGIGVFRQRALMIGIFAGLVTAGYPAFARAQVNIDQGKPPAVIYANDCATCHKTPRGLAVGKSSATLSSFLREHYTASTEQASALAAYVLGAGGREPAPKQKPELDHARAEEPKTDQAKGEEPKTGQTKGEEPIVAEPKAASRPIRASAKPEQEKSAGEESKPAQATLPTPEVAPVVTMPAAMVPAATETPSVAAKPSPAETSRSPVPSMELGSTTAAVPLEQQPNAGSTVPRDNIPD